MIIAEKGIFILGSDIILCSSVVSSLYMKMRDSPKFFSGDVNNAMDNFELFYKLSENNTEWELFNGQPMHVEACNHLCRIYTSMADRQQGSVGSQESEQEIHYLKKAFEMAKEGKGHFKCF